jgi:mono/diheme cytochrome c family protein
MRRPAFILLSAAILLSACGPGQPESADVPPDQIAATVRQATIPAQFAAGEAAFNANCASCHGQRALGTDQGPPLVHIIYEPSHHADIAFIFAVERGVRAHHWHFGDMPPVPSVSREQIDEITAYVRYLQRLVGID